MRRPSHGGPSPALIIACIALFVSLGGTGYAAANLRLGAHGAAAAHKHKQPAKPLTVKRVNRLIAAYLAAHHGLRGAAGTAGAAGGQGLAGLQGEIGKLGPQGPGAQRIVAGQRPVVPFATIATIGPWTVAMECKPGQVRIRFSGPGSYDYTVSRGEPGKTTGTTTENNNGLIEGGPVLEPGKNMQMDLHGFLIDEPNVEQFNLEVSDIESLIDSCSVTGDAIPVS